MAKTQIKNYVFKPGIGVNDNRYPNAYNLLSANKTFIQKEATAWIQDQVDAGASGFVGYTYNQTKCERDVGYVIDAYLSDLRYGGNENTRNTIKYYWDQDVAQVDGDRQPEIQTHTFIGTLIKDNILAQISYNASNTEVTQVITGLAAETTSQFTPTNATYTPTTGDMTLTIGTHNLTVGDEIFIAPGGITFTCGLDGNATEHPYPRISGVPNATGRDPYYYAPITITAVTSTTITVNVGISSDTTVHTFVSAVTNSVTSGPSAKINTLAFNTVDVITNGLSAQPKFVATGVGTIKLQGKYSINELLLITNSTRSEVIYNFTNLSTGASIEIKDGSDEDFVKFLQTTDGVTTIKLNYNTSTHLSSDDIQIFVEEKEVRTRPFDFGTDAIERMRIAPPMSMLDADFEYGLQPTKWAAIGTLRGYPSVYEIPGTDAEVTSVVTDASLSESTRIFEFTVTNSGTTGWSITGTDRNGIVSGVDPIITILDGDTLQFTNNASATHPFYLKTAATTGTGSTIPYVTNNGGFAGEIITWTPTIGSAGTYYYQCSSHAAMSGQIVVQSNNTGTGVGQSLITVSTVAPHGFNAGSPFTIKALEDSVLGAARAEGSFVVYSVPNSNAFTFYAKSKVGSIYNSILSTGYTQLRQAGFYTGASIGVPNWTIASNGSSGTMTTELAVLSGSNIIPFDGPSPEVGSPLTTFGGQIPLGTQVTSIQDTSAGGGTYISPLTNANVEAGQNQMIFQDATGVIEDLAVDRGDGYAIYITNITSNTATFSGNFTSKIIGNRQVYTNIFPGLETPIGSLAEFDISYANDSSFSYVLDAIENDGIQYEVGDTIRILGTDLGGTSPANDAIITVDSVGSANSIASASISGTHFNNDIYITNQTATYSDGIGVGAQFDIEFLDGAYSTVTLTSGAEGTDYTVGDVIVVSGGAIVPGTVGTVNDLYISVSSVGVSGDITGITFSGIAPQLDRTFTNVPYTSTTAGGTGAVIDVQITGTTYTATFTNEGINYLPTETFTIAGTDLGGASPANDLTITIDNIGGLGNVTVHTDTGVTYNGNSLINIAGSNRIPSGANFNISQNTDGAYIVDLNNPGSGYNVGQELTVSGTLFGGTSPANDITITIDTIDTIAAGSILTFSIIGAGYVPIGIYLNVAGTNVPAIGTGAQIGVTRTNGTYTGFTIESAGIDYKIGDRLTVPGGALDGVSPLNDLNIRVTEIGPGGQITNTSETYEEAYLGDNVDLISTVSVTELTTGNITAGTGIDYEALATLEINFDNAHGLVPGDTFIVTVNSDDGTNNHNLASGAFFATEIPSITTLRYTARAPGAIDESLSSIDGTIYPRPDSFFIHRPYDGGVQLGTGGPQHGAQAIRQSKKYIRYQSGKGIMYTTGALFAPSYDLRSLTADGVEVGSLITVVTDDNDHGVQEGGIIRILGVETPGYNSGPETAVPPIFDYTVEEVVDERTFKIRSQRRLGSTNAVLGFGSQMSVVSWHGATVRSGIFDDQNGIFWEYDGTNISVNQRTGTRQLAGTIAMQVDKNLLTGTNSRFQDQLKAGDRIIIKGMTHVISHVNSQTECTVTPDWRGIVDITGTKANLIVDKKVKQSDFNLDRLDGTGPSGYNIDIAKMQMIGIQYSWYGAGFIDFMLRGSDGNFVFCHRMRNSNVNTEAFMRSGNLPVRYEVTNEGPSGKLVSDLDISQTTIPLEDSSFFPTSGTVYIDNEIIRFTGNNTTTNTLTGCTRSASLSNFQAGANRSYTAGIATTHAARTGVILISNTITPLISHWGSAFLTDGGFDEDRGYIFSYAETGITVNTTKQTAFMIRLAPSVSNAIVGDLGERELLNRAQLLLQGLEVTSDGIAGTTAITGGIIVEGVLNPQNYPIDPNSVKWSGLSGVAQGGQPSFAQIAAGSGITWTTGVAATTADLTAQAAMTATAVSSDSNRRDRDFLYLRYDGATGVGPDGVNLQSGDSISGTGIRSGTVITSIGSSYPFGGVQEVFVRISQKTTQDTNVGTTYSFGRGGNLSSRNYGYFTQSSVQASGIRLGTSIDPATTSPTFPGSSVISGISEEYFGSTTYYQITFNNSYIGTLTAGSSTVTVIFEQPPYAQPGETVFSFIATPGERATLDLGELKELTNTPLGGRGTYPNGPDILAINVYKVSGADTNANIILKWGEAQA